MSRKPMNLSAIKVDEVSPIARCPPLAQVCSLFPQQEGCGWTPQVSVCLDEPLHGKGFEPAHISELFALCAQLALLWQREALVRSSDGATMAPNRFSEGAIAAEVVSQLEQSAARLQKGASLKPVLNDHGFIHFFPTVVTKLYPDIPQVRDTNFPALHEYFAHMRVLHQIMAISSQLNQDVNLSNHKYIAHQVALLYQSLNQARLPLEAYKTRVEARFEALKAVTEQSQQPTLPQSHRQWLCELCVELADIVGQVPRALTKKIQPWLDIVHHNAAL